MTSNFYNFQRRSRTFPFLFCFQDKKSIWHEPLKMLHVARRVLPYKIQKRKKNNLRILAPYITIIYLRREQNLKLHYTESYDVINSLILSTTHTTCWRPNSHTVFHTDYNMCHKVIINIISYNFTCQDKTNYSLSVFFSLSDFFFQLLCCKLWSIG